ncbi:hypothetical protein GGC63_001055 [Paenibacillus sp. OAS669]|nr:hypothetical protein [Paenibacillus sp. OAS669]
MKMLISFTAALATNARKEDFIDGVQKRKRYSSP